MTGLYYVQGEFIFLIDSDLEEDPELLEQFWAELHKNNEVDVVYGVQQLRKGKSFERWSGILFYKVFNFLSDVQIPDNMITLRLMKREYVIELLNYKETDFNFGALMVDCGFLQKPIIVKKNASATTTYNFSKKVSLAVTSIVSFSSKPLVYASYLGVLITLLSVIYLGKLVFDKLFFGIAIEGWTSLIVSVWLFGGLIILFLGIIGIYLSKIFIEVKRRPYSIVKRIYKNKN